MQSGQGEADRSGTGDLPVAHDQGRTIRDVDAGARGPPRPIRLSRGPASPPRRSLINYDSGADDVCSVVVDNEQVGYLAARHLIEQGCDHNTTAASTPVTLTTLAMHGERMGTAAMTMLLEEIGDKTGAHLHQRIVVEPALLRRGSTACDRAASA
ncbi:hypothetical protein F6J84_13250 [Microbacterium caowuchunii]|uniref:substrate-binding domain-containing protein n=1 Tax=Microbacterium caowuchunii TaxID=2614638 RepID=UPI001247FE80|nr:hypothetical protein [Microbacterium caowuchunii]QEW00967.1 hypothetical protein F6J84_13250 [Microbacterium caowuchunii]